jgi:protein O-GlcNAc transferase
MMPDQALSGIDEITRLVARGAWAEALSACAQRLAVDAQDGWALYLRGVAYHQQGMLDAALESLRAATRAHPALAEAWLRLGQVARAAMLPDEALKALRQAATLRPDAVEPSLELGMALRNSGQLGEAVVWLARAVERGPERREPLISLANALKDRGEVAAAEHLYRRRLAAAPDDLVARSNLIVAAHYDPDRAPSSLLQEAQAFGALFKTVPQAGPHDPNPERPLRVGLLSADFRAHPVGWFVEAALRHTPRNGLSLVGLSLNRRDDARTAVLRGLADAWVDLPRALSDAALAERLRAERVDVLIDLHGHSADNRLGALALRAAPVQATWVGFPATTGLAAIDYIIADPHMIPPAHEPLFSETPVRLPSLGWCWTPPPQTPAVAPLPMAVAGAGVRFASFNNPAKLNALVLRTWAAVLTAVPGSRLLLKYFGLDDADTAARLRSRCRAAGIADARLELQGWSGHTAALATYGTVDVALDPFPFGGGTTTCEALWMGVPVVSLFGATMPSRLGLALLTAAGMRGLATSNPADYVAKAAGLVADAGALAQLRGALRPMVARSAITDGAAHGAVFAQAVRAMWRRRCAVTG